MKSLTKILFFLTLILTVFACGADHKNEKTANNTNTNSLNMDKDVLYVYYFHKSIRCKTCIAVGEQSHSNLVVLYPEKVRNSEIVFKSFNIEDEANQELIKRYEIWGQTLLFIKGKKVINKTNEAFMYVPTNPEKWMTTVKETVDSLLI